MEYHGVKLDRDRTQQYSDILTERLAELQDSIWTGMGERVNLSSSSPELSNFLYKKEKLDVPKYTASGDPSTDAETLRVLADKYNRPYLLDLLAYRKLDKCLHTYINNWLDLSKADGHIHCSFNQIGTATYRLSSSNPNLQNVPFQLKEANLNLKSLFLPDSDDYEIYDADISNAEMRVLTAYSEDEALIDAFNSGKDLHCLTAAGISEYTYDDIKAHKEDKTSDQYRKRQLAKKINFGTIYSMGPDKLKDQLWTELRIQETTEQCQKYLDDFFKAYPGVATYIRETKKFVENNRFTWTFTGHRRRFNIIEFDNSQTARMFRQAINARIQTTSSDLVMYNLIDLHNWLLQRGGRVLITVHDSIVFQLPKGIGPIMPDLKRLITQGTAERAPWLPVEWKFDVGKGPNYGEVHEEAL